MKIFGKTKQPKLLVKDMLQFLEKAESAKERMKYQLENSQHQMTRPLPGMGDIIEYLQSTSMVVMGSMTVAGNWVGR